MGANESHGHGKAKGNIFIELDHPCFNAGEYVTGKIHLYVKESFSARRLCVLIKGEEKTKVKRDDGETIDRYKSVEKIFHQENDVFYFADDHCPAGQFTFPFTIQIPHWLPSSFFLKHHSHPEKVKSMIKYKVKAHVESLDHHGGKIDGKRVLIVRPPPPMSV